MTPISATRGGVRTKLNSEIATKFKTNTGTTASVAGKSTTAQTVAQRLQSATLNTGVSRDMMSNTGSILSKQQTSQTKTTTNTSGSTSATSTRTASSGTATNFVSSAHQAKQDAKFYELRQSHSGGFMVGSNYSSNRAQERRFMNSYAQLNAMYQQNSVNKFNEVVAGVQVGASAVKTLWDMFSTKVETGQGTSGTDGNGTDGNGGTTGTGSSTSSMSGLNLLSSAENSAELSSGIELAKSDLAKSKKDLDTTNKQISNQSSINADLKVKCDEALACLELANDNLKLAIDGKDKAVKDFNNAQKSYDDIKKSYDAAPAEQKATIKPQLELAQKKLDAAREQKTLKEMALIAAKQDQDDAVLEKGEKDKLYQQGLKTINDLNAKKERLTNDNKNYEKKIAEAEKKLEKMIEKEKNEADKLEIKGTDNIKSGISKMEKGKNSGGKKVDKGNARFDKAREKDQKVAIARAPKLVANGRVFATAKGPDGEPVYAINGVLVKEDEYNTRLEESKKAELNSLLQDAVPFMTKDGKALKTAEFAGATVYSINDQPVDKAVYDAAMIANQA